MESGMDDPGPPLASAVSNKGTSATALTVIWEPPHFVLAQPALSPTGLIAVTLPLVIILVGMNLVPSCAFLDGQQYRPPTGREPERLLRPPLWDYRPQGRGCLPSLGRRPPRR